MGCRQQTSAISIIRMLHRRDRTYRRGFTEEKDERMGCDQAIRAVSLDRRNRFLSNQDGQPERPYQSPHPEPISPFPSHSPLTSNDSPKSQDKDEPKSEPHLSTLIDNIPTQQQQNPPTNPNPEEDCSNIHNKSNFLSLSRQISFETKQFVRKFQEIEEKIKDGGQKVTRRGRPPSKKSQLINKVAGKEKSILEDKIFDSEEGSKQDKSILVEPKKRSRKRNADLDVSTASQVVKRGRKVPVHAQEEAEKEQEKEGGKEGGVKRIRQLEGLTDGHLEYLVEYGPRKHRVMSTLKLIQTHPTSFASYLDSKK